MYKHKEKSFYYNRRKKIFEINRMNHITLYTFSTRYDNFVHFRLCCTVRGRIVFNETYKLSMEFLDNVSEYSDRKIEEFIFFLNSEIRRIYGIWFPNRRGGKTCDSGTTKPSDSCQQLSSSDSGENVVL